MRESTASELAKVLELAQPSVKKWLAGELGDEAGWITKLDAAVAAITLWQIACGDWKADTIF